MHRNVLLTGAAFMAASGAVALWRRSQAMDLRRKVVLITGGSRGLGLALAREFANQGCSLALCARSEAELERAKQDLALTAHGVITFACDVGDRDQVQQFVEGAVRHYGRIDVLVNNAGIIQVGPIHTMTIEDFEAAMHVMFWGPVYATLAALPYLRERRQARVVNITSVGAKVSVPHLLPYSCAKFAAGAFSEGLRAELQPTSVKVVTIVPGLMRTGSYLNALFKGDDEGEAAWFSVSSSLPGLTIAAERAAREIVSATRSGRAEHILSMPAKMLARFHGLFSGATPEILGLINRFLPRGGKQIAHGAEISALQRPLLYALTTLGRAAAKRLGQPATT